LPAGPGAAMILLLNKANYLAFKKRVNYRNKLVVVVVVVL